MPREDVKKLLRSKFMPHIWCPGCGHGIIMHSILRAIADLDIPREQVCISSGIGCSSRMPGYIDACTLHTAHGRSLAFATGVKMANPDLTIVNVMGDGDGTAIGGNHFIHACRRNIGITAVLMNNNIYGMTGGQASPTTPEGAFGPLRIDRPDVRHLQARRRRGRDLCGARHGSEPRDVRTDTQEGDRTSEEGLCARRDHLLLPYAVWPQEQAQPSDRQHQVP